MRDRGPLVSFLSVAGAYIASAIAWPRLPARVPTHWGLSGAPDAFGGRLEGALLIPTVMLVVWIVLVLAPRYYRLIFIKYEPSDSDSTTVRPVYNLIITVTLTLLLAIHVFALTSSAGLISGTRQPLWIAVITSVGGVILGNYMPRVTRRNAFIGFRVPWAYASEDVWRRTQRAGGYGMVAAGIVGLIGAVAAPSAPLKPLFAAMMTQLVIVAAYSYYLAHSAAAHGR